MRLKDNDLNNMDGQRMEVKTESAEEKTKKELTMKAKPTCCQGIKPFLAALAFAYFSKVFAGAVVKSSVTQMERRFGISSSTAGFIDGGFELGNLLVIAFVSYFGAKYHRPKIIAIGCFIMSLGCFLMALPHFFMGYYKYDTLSLPSTNSNSTFSPCSFNRTALELKDCDQEVISQAWIFVLLGNLLRGIGETPTTPLGISYLDDFSREEDVPVYISFLHTIAMIGPIAGFLLGSLLATIYVDIGFVDLDTITITSTDARWVGAWWMGFLFAGVISLVSGIPFLFLPKSLETKENSSNQNTLENLKNSHQNTDPQKSDAEGGILNSGKLKEFFKSLERLLRNQMYVTIVASSLLGVSSIIGYVTYKPKYMEQQYGQPMSRSNFITAVAVLPVVSIGIFAGGFIMKKYKLSIISTTKMTLATGFIAFALSFLLLMVGCDDRRVAGLTVSYDGQAATRDQLSLSSACNDNCTCVTDQWDPVCGDNGLTYASACFAGCKHVTGSKKETVFHNCSCIEGAGVRNSSAVLGECQRSNECSRSFIYYIIISAVGSFIYALSSIPGYILMIRCVPQDMKSLAVGLFMLVIRALGGIPAPVYFGAVIDKSCLKWASNQCGQKGACRLYDAMQYRYSFFGLTLGLRGPCFLLGLVFLWLVKKHFGGQEEKEAEPEQNEDVPLNAQVTKKSEVTAQQSNTEMDSNL